MLPIITMHVILVHKSVPFQVTKTIQDPTGRYIIAQGNIWSYNLNLNLIHIYGPNEDSPLFCRKLLLAVSTLEGLYILGRDFNWTLDPAMDRPTRVDTTHVQTWKILTEFIKDLRLIDVWRKQNPDKFSCHSSYYKTYSRIDYFLVSCACLNGSMFLKIRPTFSKMEISSILALGPIFY